MNLTGKAVVVPTVTPFTADGELDEPKVRQLVNHLIDKGVHALFPGGSTGEGWALTREERKRLFEITVEEARGRVSVWGGTGALTTRESIYLTRMAEEVGCDGAVLITPFYITPNGDELYEHYAAIARAVKIPIFPYNNPARASGVNIPADTVARLSDIDNVGGIKDSAGNISLTRQYIEVSRPDFAVYQGQDGMFFPGFCVGCTGVVALTANLAPDLVLEVWKAFTAGDMARAIKAQDKLSILRRTSRLGTYPAVIKESMAMIGMPMGPTRGPVMPLSEQNRVILRKELQAAGVLPA